MKQIAPDRPRASLMNKFAGGAKKQAMKPPNKAPAPKDPAALSSLGLEPPERPAAIHNGSNAATRTPSGYGAAPTGTSVDNAALRQGPNKTGEKVKVSQTKLTPLTLTIHTAARETKWTVWGTSGAA